LSHVADLPACHNLFVPDLYGSASIKACQPVRSAMCIHFFCMRFRCKQQWRVQRLQPTAEAPVMLPLVHTALTCLLAGRIMLTHLGHVPTAQLDLMWLITSLMQKLNKAATIQSRLEAEEYIHQTAEQASFIAASIIHLTVDSTSFSMMQMPLQSRCLLIRIVEISLGTSQDLSQAAYGPM